ncbi:cell division protein FtsQ/DivIB [Gilvimarinus polysaccharolyticus]|uniref:cell division protein FtsQ/DivIB n=1 Tax=Gilvimarinus polysaccharolyticus TaxID=863921 RepID=UPI0006738F95|nr:cell division protein FtsQ/DivIB [Gilvimarinus polysaccharolyticus]
MSQRAVRAKGYRQATPRGASRSSSAAVVARLLKLMSRVALVVLIGGIGFSTYYYGGAAVTRVLQHPVDEVRVEGPFHFVSREAATDLISSAIDNKFVDLDIAQLKQKIEQHSWVERAVITRSLPSALIITLEEQVPIARWGDIGFLNQRGEVVYTAETQFLDDLPELNGREQQSARIMQQYQDLSRLLRSRNLSIARLWVDELSTWRITLARGVELVLGKDDLVEKIQRFLLVYDEHLIQQFEAVVRIDLRYTNGLAVAWSDEYEVLVQKTS